MMLNSAAKPQASTRLATSSRILSRVHALEGGRAHPAHQRLHSHSARPRKANGRFSVFVKASLEGEEDVQGVPSSAPAEEIPADTAEVVQEKAGQTKGSNGFTSQFKLNVLWQDDFCAVAVDQVIRIQGRGQNVHRTPVTEYFFWPKVDAWEEMKKTLESKSWIAERDTILLLNSLTEVVNFWQEAHSKQEAKEKFGKDITFEA